MVLGQVTGCPFNNPQDCPFYKKEAVWHDIAGLRVKEAQNDAFPPKTEDANVHETVHWHSHEPMRPNKMNKMGVVPDESQSTMDNDMAMREERHEQEKLVLYKDIEKLKIENQAAEKHVQRLEVQAKQIQTLEQQVAVLQVQLSDKGDLAKRAEELQEQVKAKNHMLERLDKLQQKFHAQGAHIEESKTLWIQRNAEMQVKERELEKERQEVKRQKDKCDQTLSEYQSGMRVMAQKEYDLTTEKAAMEEMQKDLVEKWQELQKEEARHQQEVSKGLKDADIELSRTKSQHECDILKQKEEKELLRAEKFRLGQQVTELQATVAMLETERQKAAAHTDLLKNAQNALDQAKALAERKNQDQEALEHRVAELEAALEDTERQRAQLKAAMHTQEASCHQEQQDKAQVQAKLAQMQIHVKELESTEEMQQRKIMALEEECGRLQRGMANLKRESYQEVQEVEQERDDLRLEKRMLEQRLEQQEEAIKRLKFGAQRNGDALESDARESIFGARGSPMSHGMRPGSGVRDAMESPFGETLDPAFGGRSRMEPELRARESAFGPQSHGEPAHGPTDGAESAFGMRDVGHRSPQDGRPLMQSAARPSRPEQYPARPMDRGRHRSSISSVSGVQAVDDLGSITITLGELVATKRGFELADCDRNGYLDVATLGEYCVQRGVKQITYGQLMQMIDAVDPHKTGVIQFFGFFGIQSYLFLKLKARGISLREWITFCTQEAPNPPPICSPRSPYPLPLPFGSTPERPESRSGTSLLSATLAESSGGTFGSPMAPPHTAWVSSSEGLQVNRTRRALQRHISNAAAMEEWQV
uniref:EF-hand domain-containing protein n=1 Tax=Eutreptiella gymnastica TaxID=73025 RepID=A0A7S4GKX8_9EUGL|mmetsp:Transcript_87665/g.145677  ORF Transcript_87665/g.145677 Transcript_87665/m.145677 type:complete len:819 (-) Transcript_87665:1411-3867(-)